MTFVETRYRGESQWWNLGAILRVEEHDLGSWATIYWQGGTTEDITDPKQLAQLRIKIQQANSQERPSRA